MTWPNSTFIKCARCYIKDNIGNVYFSFLTGSSQLSNKNAFCGKNSHSGFKAGHETIGGALLE